MPENDGTPKPFYVKLYVKFWFLKQPLCLIKKKDRDTRFNSWRPTSLLNVDMKFISKALACNLKTSRLPSVNENQVAYVNNRFKNSVRRSKGFYFFR